MTMYCWYQEQEQSVWHLALASERQNLLRTHKAALITCLDADNDFSGEMSAEDIQAVKYFGNYYADFDSETIEIAIEQVKKFLTLLKSKGVDLNQIQVAATGGRGFHVTIPQAMYMTKVQANGVVGLPHIYKEVSYSLYVDDLDLRTYTARRGRLFRCANVKRSNGNYKVFVTIDEVMNMTAESYATVCSSPRADPPIDPPTFCPELGLLYATAQDKVTKALAKRKTKKKTSDDLKKFGGNWPEVFTLICNGVGLRDDVGFNSIAMQIAVTGCALGKAEDQIIADCEGLIETHKGDSSRYGTPAKRRAFLREMIRYCDSNPLYEFSPGAVLNLLIKEVRANADIGMGDWQPDTPEPQPPVVNEDGTTTTPEPSEQEDENAPVKISKHGIFVRSDNGYARCCDIGLGKAIALKNMDMTHLGFEVEAFSMDRPLGVQMLPIDKLLSRSAFQTWTSQWSRSMSASDIQTARIMDALSNRTEASKAVTFVVTREGVDLVVPPGSKSDSDFEIVWASPNEVIGSKGNKYHFRSTLDKGGTYKSDLMAAPALTVEDHDLIHNLLHMNTTENLAKMLGWFSAAFLTQIIRRFYGQFPSMQCYGQAGAGKSKSVKLLNNLHYYLQPTKESQATGQTMYPMIVNVATSSSQPVVFEEVKAREMNATLRAFLLNLFRSNYDGHHLARGALTKDVGSKEVTVNSYANSGPIVFVGESVENQSAILERCIVVSLTKQDRYGKSDAYHYVANRRCELGKVGKAIVENIFAIDMRQMRAEFDAIFDQVRDSLGAKAEEMERPMYNIAVVVLGLKLLKDTLHGVFGDTFDARLQEMQDAMVENVANNIPVNMSEVSRVIDTMAQLSRNADPQYQLVHGEDYTINDDGKTMDLKLRTTYVKYVKWQRSLGQEVLFDNEAAFIAGMMNYAGSIRKSCPDNVLLHDSIRAIVHRIDLEYLEKEGVDSFKS